LCNRIIIIAGTPVDLAGVTAPLLNVVALPDHLCTPAVRAPKPLVGSGDNERLELERGTSA
jgi:hypothetical protein